MSALRIVSYSASGLGLLIVGIPFLSGSFSGIQSVLRTQASNTEQLLAKDNIKRQEELRRFGYEERQKTLDKASRIGEHIEYKQVTVENYSFSHNHAPKIDTSAFKANEHIQVFDRNGVCIGRIRNQRFEFKVHYLNTCLTIQTTKKTN